MKKNLEGQDKNNKDKGKKWLVARIIFAAVALAVVINTIQLKDTLIRDSEVYYFTEDTSSSTIKLIKDEKDSKTLNIIEKKDNLLILEDSRGQRIILKYQPGLITICRSIDIKYALLSVIIFAAVPILLAARWRTLLQAVGIELSLISTIKIVFAARLMNFLFISTTGGDLFKAYWASNKGYRTEAFVSVFVDRFIGFAFITIFTLALSVVFINDPNVNKLIKPIIALMICFILLFVMLFSKSIRRLIRLDTLKESPHRIPFYNAISPALIEKIIDIIAKIDAALLSYRHKTKAVIIAGIYTAILQIDISTSVYLFGKAIGIETYIWYYWLYVPLAFIVGSIPVSVLWGLGLMEGAYIALFAGSKLANTTQAAMLAMGARILQLIWSLPGALTIIKLPPPGKKIIQ